MTTTKGQDMTKIPAEWSAARRLGTATARLRFTPDLAESERRDLEAVAEQARTEINDQHSS